MTAAFRRLLAAAFTLTDKALSAVASALEAASKRLHELASGGETR